MKVKSILIVLIQSMIFLSNQARILELNTRNENDSHNIFQPTKGRIINGKRSPIGRYPYHATINIVRKDGELFNVCGGALIDPNWVITAGHCAESFGTDIVVEVGRDSYMKKDADTNIFYERNADFKCIHDKFEASNYHYDIALIYFKDPLTDIKPISYTQSHLNLKPFQQSRKSHLTIMGFGSMEIFGDGPYPKRMQEGDVHFVREEECEELVSLTTGIDMFTDWTMCATGNGVQDTCVGDSGGPLIIAGEEEKEDVLVGVVSIGPVPCNTEDTPVLYTRVSKAYNWIQDVMNGIVDECKE